MKGNTQYEVMPHELRIRDSLTKGDLTYTCPIGLGCLVNAHAPPQQPCQYGIPKPLFIVHPRSCISAPNPSSFRFPNSHHRLQCSSFVSLSQHTNTMTYLAPVTPITSSLRGLMKPHLPVTWCSVTLLPASLCQESLKLYLRCTGTFQLHNLARKYK